MTLRRDNDEVNQMRQMRSRISRDMYDTLSTVKNAVIRRTSVLGGRVRTKRV